MRYVLLKKSKILGALALSVMVSSCSLKSNGQQQTVTIALPGAQISQFQWIEKMTDWMSMAWAGTTTSINLNDTPTALTDFDCFAVNVTGPGIPPDPIVSCSDPNDAPAIFGGFVPNGNSSIDLLVPAGSNRSIKILGVKTTLSGCPNLRDLAQSGTLQLKDNVSEFYTIGGANTDIFADTSINIKASYNANSPTTAFNNCQRNDGKNGQRVWSVFAGTGPGKINTTKTVNGTAFIGGTFDYVGPTTNQGAMLSQTNGTIASTSNNPAHISGIVQCSMPDGKGGFYVGGKFSRVETSTFTTYPAGLIHIYSDGSFDSNFVVTMDSSGTIKSCAIDITKQILFVAGTFSNLTGPSGGQQSASALAAIPLSTKVPYDLSGKFSSNSGINALDVDQTYHRLIVGGSFTTTNGRTNAAAFDTSPNSAPSYNELSWTPNPTGGPVNAIYVDNVLTHSAYLGGSFNLPHTNLMHVDLTGNYDNLWTPSITNPVTAITKKNGNVYVSSTDPTYSYPQIYRIDSTGSSVNSILSGSSTSESFNSLAVATDGSNQLFVGGQFKIGEHQNLISIVNPSTAPIAPSMTSFNASFMASANGGSTVYTVTANETGKLYAGGNFVSAGGIVRKNLAAIDLASGQATPWTSYYSIAGEVSAIEADGSSIYVATQTQGGTAPCIMRMSTAGGSSGAWQKYSGSNLYDSIYTLTLNNGALYVGGTFTSLNGGTASGFGNAARMDAASGSLDLNWHPVLGTTGPSGSKVYKILKDQDTVYLGGNFSNINGSTSMTSLVAIEGAAGATGGKVSTWNDPHTSLYGGVNSMVIVPGGTYNLAPAGGLLVGVMGAGSNIRFVDGSGNVDLGWSKAPSASTELIHINQLVRDGDTLYIAGQSQTAGQALLAYDLKTESMTGLALGILGSTNNNVYSVEAVGNGNILIGGDFQQVNISGNTPGGMMSWGLGLFDANNGKLY